MDNWDSGVRTGQHRKLSATSVMEANLLGVPLCAMNPRSSKSKNQIFYSWTKNGVKADFVFSRIGDEPYPLPEHAKILDCLIAHFANNFTEDGKVHFRMGDIARDCGFSPSGGSARKVIKETIKRYQQSHVSWTLGFDGKTDTWTGSIIQYSSLTDPRHEGKNPRNSRQREDWHTVVFHKLIVESIRDKKIRVLLTDAMRSLPADVYILYRWLRRFTDKEQVNKKLSTVKNAVNLNLRPDKFRNWLDQKLSHLKDGGYVTDYKIHEDWFQVRIKPLKQQQVDQQLKLLI